MVRRLIVGSLLITGVLTVVIIVCTVIGVQQTTGAAVARDPSGAATSAMLWTGVPILVVTVIGIGAFVWLFRSVLGADRKVLATGMPGTAVVTEVSDTGATINEVNAVIELGLEVTVPGRPAYPAKTQVMLNRMSWGAMRVGMTLPVKVDVADPSKVAVDWGGQRDGGVGAILTMPGVEGGRRVEATRSADDIVARGEKAGAVILAVSDTGKTGAELSPGAHKPERANDPVVYASLRVEPEDGAPFTAEGAHRVPRDRLADLSIGAHVAVAYLPGERNSVTFDWERF